MMMNAVFSATFLAATFTSKLHLAMIVPRSYHRLSTTTKCISSSAAASAAVNTDVLGPPSVLASLRMGESHTVKRFGQEEEDDICITRISYDPDIFVARNWLGEAERESLLHTPSHSFKVAGTRQSQTNTIRKNSSLTWIDPLENAVANLLEDLSQAMLVHEALTASPHEKRSEYIALEDLQVAKYAPGGSFDLHHDGLNRFVTVLTYLNGVGGTYFPMAQTSLSSNHHPEPLRVLPSGLMLPERLQRCIYKPSTSNDEALPITKEFSVGQEGLLVVGKEGESAYCSLGSTCVAKNAIVRIQAGDALIFYSYKDGLYNDGGDEQQQQQHPPCIVNYRSMHAGLKVPEEKWIATNWIRSSVFTGPHARLYKERLFGPARKTQIDMR